MLKERRENRYPIGGGAKLLPRGKASLSSKQLSGVSVFKGKVDTIQKCIDRDCFSKPYPAYIYGGSKKDISSQDKSFVLPQEEILLSDQKAIYQDIGSERAKFFSAYLRKYQQIKFILLKEKEVPSRKNSLVRAILNNIDVVEESHYTQSLPEAHTQSTSQPQRKRQAGFLKGTFALPLPEDFNEPLEDFQEYME
jgi:Protein of unknown function (DUF2281)